MSDHLSFLSGSKENSWRPAMTANTTNPSYWLNWRVLLCAIWILVSMVLAAICILKNEGNGGSRPQSGENEKEKEGFLYEDETWRPCLKEIHPAWLLAFRVICFFVLLVLLIVTAVVDGVSIFYYYTQWTFALVTIYFGLGSLLSIYGCYQYHNRVHGDRVTHGQLDTELGTYTNGVSSENFNRSNMTKNLGPNEPYRDRQPAGFWGYIFQIIFQMNAGAVILTDCVFWFVIVPFLAVKDYNLNFLIINMHSINVVLLLGDTALNCLRFPWFRIGYFFLWTCVYVIFQWIVHACIFFWWPYPFLDLSSLFAPLWYFLVAVLHIPCFGAFALIMKLKHVLLTRWFPQSYQCVR
ncbi:hypothetical protein RJ641_009166 [Dillenia turbinata]|uniref:Uncharacterized protein n=1 Tax=Dillenia turbinata TaxID=194707 RepID=A0AAN8Z729_9MAGN